VVPRFLDLTRVAFWVVTVNSLPAQINAARAEAGYGLDGQTGAAEVVSLQAEQKTAFAEFRSRPSNIAALRSDFRNRMIGQKVRNATNS
jgi:hypothetical protein